MSEINPLSARKQGRREFLKASGAVTAALLAPSAAIICLVLAGLGLRQGSVPDA